MQNNVIFTNTVIQKKLVINGSALHKKSNTYAESACLDTITSYPAYNPLIYTVYCVELESSQVKGD